MSSIPLMLKHRLAIWMAKGVNVPFHLLFHEPWDRVFWGEWLRAHRYLKRMDPSKVRRVFILSYSRSGTHNFYTHFHYHPSVFAFGENIYYDPETDPYQFRWDWPRVSSPHFLYGSAFLEQGLQQKDGVELTHAFFLSNHYLKAKSEIDPALLHPADRVIFYQRNFIRTLYSMDQCGRKLCKSHFVMTDENYAFAVHSHRNKLQEMLCLAETDPTRFHFCFHELFCARLQEEMLRVANAVELPLPSDPAWMDPTHFFQRCHRSGKAPLLRNQQLHCQDSGKMIVGKGGSYNPIPPVSLKRTLSDPVDQWLNTERLSLARAAFGSELVDFWLSDATFSYEEIDTDYLVRLINRSLARTQNFL